MLIKRELSLPLVVALCRCTSTQSSGQAQGNALCESCAGPVGDQAGTLQDALSWKGQSVLLHSSIQSSYLHRYLLLSPHSSVQPAISISPGAPAPGLLSSRSPSLPSVTSVWIFIPLSHIRDLPFTWLPHPSARGS